MKEKSINRNKLYAIIAATVAVVTVIAVTAVSIINGNVKNPFDFSE